jgi:hypothetical protein
VVLFEGMVNKNVGNIGNIELCLWANSHTTITTIFFGVEDNVY